MSHGRTRTNTESEVIAGARQRVISPVDGSVYAEFDLPSAAEIETTVERAVCAQDAWKPVPLTERSAICRRMTDAMVKRADAIGTELTWQIGRPVTQSPFEIRRGFQERARYMVDVAGDALADVVMESKDGFRRFIRREPLGVVLVLAPWNYPYLASVNTVVPAIVAGNSVILKVSQQTRAWPSIMPRPSGTPGCLRVCSSTCTRAMRISRG